MRKKLIILFTLTVAIVLLTISSFAADNYVFKASELKGMIEQMSPNLDYEEITKDGVDYLRIFMSSPNSNGYLDKAGTHVKFNIFNNTPLFNVDDFPFVGIAYKTNITMTNNKFSINAGMKINGSYLRCWSLSYTGMTNDKPSYLIYDVRNFSGTAEQSGVDYGDVDASGGIKFIRIPPWADSDTTAAEDLLDDYFDIEAIGFFKSAADAAVYFDDSVYTVTYYDVNGNVYKTFSYNIGQTHTRIAGPSVSGLTFNSWVNSSKTPVPESFAIDSSHEFYPVYDNNVDYYVYYPELFEVTTTKMAAQSTLVSKNGLNWLHLTPTTTGKHDGTASFTVNIPDNFPAKQYKYIAVKYITNITGSSSWFGSNNSLAIYPTLKYKEAYYEFGAITANRSGNETEQVLVVSLDNFKSGNVSGVGSLSDIDGNSAFNAIRLSPWGDGSGGNNWWGSSSVEIKSSDYFDIAYIGFFKTESAAKNFNPSSSAAAVHYSFMEYGDDLYFNPDKNLTRADAAKAVAAMVLKGADVPTTNTSRFTDITKTNDCYYAVAYLEKLGYLTANGKFNPSSSITSADLISLVNKAAANNSHISNADSSIATDTYITRAKAAELFCKSLGRKPTVEAIKHVTAPGPIDVERNEQSGAYIIEACYDHVKVDNWDKNEFWVSAYDDDFYMKKASDSLIEQLNNQLAQRAEAIRASESDWSVAAGGKIYYVSNKGSDSNSGLSESKPLKTIGRVQDLMNNNTIKAGDVILFERGGEWYPTEGVDSNGYVTQTKLKVNTGITVSAYGKGDKPRILCSLDASGASNWTKVSGYKDLYVFNKPIGKDRDVGNIVFNDGTFHWEGSKPVYDNSAYGLRLIDDPKSNNALQPGHNDGPNGSFVVSNGPTQWVFNTTNYTFNKATDLQAIATAIPESDLMYCHDENDNKVYLICKKGNPGDVFDRIDLCTKGGVSATTGVTLDNLCIKFTGSHGVGAGSSKNLIIRNCEVGYIGGSVQIWNDNRTRYGNAVEVYGEADGFYVYDCYMYQCFDCGPTVQVTESELVWGDPLIQKDVHFYGNALWNAALEVWLSTGQDNFGNYYAALINCKMYDNLVAFNGYGFQGYTHQKHDYCGFYGGGYTRADYIDCYMENNTFWNLRMNLLKCVPTSSVDGDGFHWRNNTIIHRYDEYLGLLGADTKTATGSSTRYYYNNETIRTLVGNGGFGQNSFYYTVSEGKQDPAPNLPSVDSFAGLGDYDNDGKISANDIITLARSIAGWKGYDIPYNKDLDLDSDGKIGSIDLVIISRHIAKWIGYENIPLDNSK